MSSGSPRRAQFPATRWSVVLAVQDPDGEAAKAALSHLCEAYWYPIYAFVRRTGKPAQDAEDLTQAFFARLIERDVLASARSERGKLRSFLLATLKHFLSDEWDKANALKRGGGKPAISIDSTDAEERYALEPKDEDSPDRQFERRWAQAVLERVLTALRDQYRAKGQEALFDELQKHIAWNAGDSTYAEAAAGLGMTENAFRVAVFRLRQRYGKELKNQIADTVDQEEDISAEIDFLYRAVQA